MMMLLAAVSIAVPVYLAPPPSTPFTDANTKRIKDSIADVRKILGKKKEIVLVDTPAQAIIVLTLVDSTMAQTGQTHTHTSRVTPVRGIYSLVDGRVQRREPSHPVGEGQPHPPSREDTNREEDSGTIIITKYCYRYVYSDRAVLS